MEHDLKNLTADQLLAVVKSIGERKFLAGYIFTFIHAKRARTVSDITPLSKAFRAKLESEGYYVGELEVLERLTDPDGTVKYVFGLHDGARVEAVLLFDGKRRTLCVSTQVGCRMGCIFCATGKMGFGRNLSTAEILEQVYTVVGDGEKLTNVVYMGMGEPLENYDHVVRSIEILNHSEGLNLGIRHITVSTSGVVPGIDRLGKERVVPRLAVSLNAPTDSLRSRIMPINNKYPLKLLINAIRTYQASTRRRVTFEYVLIKGFNDSELHAKLLIKLIRGIMCHVNLIQFNPHPGCEMAASETSCIERFRKALDDAGVEVTVRHKMGQAVQGACGQLGARAQQEPGL